MKPPHLKKRFSLGTGPAADWKVIFLASAFLALVLTGINLFALFTLRSRTHVDRPAEETRTLNLEVLKNTTTYYQNRALEFQRILSGTTTPADPSL